MATAETSKEDRQFDALRTEWLNRLFELINRVENWAIALDWSTRRIEKRMQDMDIGNYNAPALILQRDTTRALLEPIARLTPGSKGVVDLCVMPAYDDIATFSYLNGDWHLHHIHLETSAGNSLNVALPQPLTQELLKQVLDEMVINAE